MSTSESAVNGNISKCQLAYIDKIKQQIADSSSAIPLCYNPDNYAPRGVPKLEETFWLKPVYVMDPEKQFVGLKIKCSKCDKHFASDGWSPNYRHVHCLNTSAYLLQKKMKCKCQKSNTTVYELLQFDSVPDYLKLFYPFADTPKSMIHDEITTLLMTDCVTAKTFYEIGQTIASFRLQQC